MESSVPLQGRPYGGCAILFRESLIIFLAPFSMVYHNFMCTFNPWLQASAKCDLNAENPQTA